MVASDAALTTTGPFSALDAELHLRIFSLLGQDDLLRCVFEVCKGWRALRRDPALWRSVALCSPKFSSAGALAFVSGPRSPLSSPACVQELKIEGKQAFGAATLETLLLTLTHVTRISLRGNHLTPELLLLLAEPRAAPLERLELQLKHGEVEGVSDEMQAALQDVFVASPALTSLSVNMVMGSWLLDAAERSFLARGRVKHPLRKLHIGSYSYISCESGYQCGMCAWVLSLLGAAFPELTSIAVASLRLLDVPGSLPWRPFAALRTLRVANLGDYPWMPRATTSAQLQQLLSCIAGAAPNLTTLELSRGEEHLSPQEIHDGVQPTPLPFVGAGAGGVFALQQLQTLKLRFVHITAADAADAHLPSLRELHLDDCGAHAAAAAVVLAAAAPALQFLMLDVHETELDGSEGPGVGALSALSHGTLSELRIFSSIECFSHTARGQRAAEVKAAKAFAHEIKALATRKALPALRSLQLGAVHTHPCFAASQPWPLLQSLGLYSWATADSIPACLAGLRAPALTELTLPGIRSGVASVKSRHDKPPTKAMVDAYEALRAKGHAPKLPPLRTAGASADAE